MQAWLGRRSSGHLVRCQLQPRDQIKYLGINLVGRCQTDAAAPSLRMHGVDPCLGTVLSCSPPGNPQLRMRTRGCGLVHVYRIPSRKGCRY